MDYPAYSNDGREASGGGADARGRKLDVEKSVVKFKTRICLFWLGGNCPYAERCMYAHGNAELRADPANDVPGITPDTNPRYRTRLCKHFMNSNGMHCPHGIRCAFAHGLEELAHYTRLADAGIRAPTVVTADSEEIPASATGIPHFTPGAMHAHMPPKPTPPAPMTVTMGMPGTLSGAAPGATHGDGNDVVSPQMVSRLQQEAEAHAKAAAAAAAAAARAAEAVARAQAQVDTIAADKSTAASASEAASSKSAALAGGALSVDTLATGVAGMSLATNGSETHQSGTDGDSPLDASPLSTRGATASAVVPSTEVAASEADAHVAAGSQPAVRSGMLPFGVQVHPDGIPADPTMPRKTMEMLRRMNPSELAVFLNEYYSKERSNPDGALQAAAPPPTADAEVAGHAPQPQHRRGAGGNAQRTHGGKRSQAGNAPAGYQFGGGPHAHAGHGHFRGGRGRHGRGGYPVHGRHAAYNGGYGAPPTGAYPGQWNGANAFAPDGSMMMDPAAAMNTHPVAFRGDAGMYLDPSMAGPGFMMGGMHGMMDAGMGYGGRPQFYGAYEGAIPATVPGFGYGPYPAGMPWGGAAAAALQAARALAPSMGGMAAMLPAGMERMRMPGEATLASGAGGVSPSMNDDAAAPAEGAARSVVDGVLSEGAADRPPRGPAPPSAPKRTPAAVPGMPIGYGAIGDDGMQLNSMHVGYDGLPRMVKAGMDAPAWPAAVPSDETPETAASRMVPAFAPGGMPASWSHWYPATTFVSEDASQQRVPRA